MDTRIFSALALTLVLGACSSTPTTQTGQQLKDIVRAERGSYASEKCMVPADLVGQPHTVLAGKKFASPIRVIFPGTTVTGDQVANRLNFKVDKKGNITSITCG